MNTVRKDREGRIETRSDWSGICRDADCSWVSETAASGACKRETALSLKEDTVGEKDNYRTVEEMKWAIKT